MAQEGGRIEVTNRELAIFFGSVFVALFIMTAGAVGWFDPLTAGIVVTTIVVFFVLGQWLEAKGAFGSGMSMVFVVLGLSVVMIFSGLVYRGVIPLVFYSSSTPVPALVISSAMIYALIAVLGIALVVAVYYVRTRKPIAIFGK